MPDGTGWRPMGRCMMRNLSIGVVSSLALAAGLAAPAHAQDEGAAASGSRLSEIVVTAEFREANVQDTPIAITAVNAEMLEARGQTDIAQVASQAPNVTLKPQNQVNGNGMIAFIRGIGQTNFNLAMEPGVGIYVDDVYIPTVTGSLLDLMDLDRVEVLRGPQGTLAGKNSIGGAIKLFNSKPSGDNGGSLQATYGSFNRLDIRGVADFAITDNFYARIAGVSKNRDGYVTRLDYAKTHPGTTVPTFSGADEVIGTLGGKSYAAGRLSLRWVPSDTFEVNVSGDYTHDKSEAGAAVLNRLNATAAGTTPDGRPFLLGTDGQPVIPDCRFVPYGQYSCDTLSPSLGYNPKFVSYATFMDAMPPTFQAPFKPFYAEPIAHFKGGGVQGTIEVDLSDDFQVKSITAYREYTSTWGNDSDGTPVPNQQQINTLDFHYFSQELRLNGELADGLVDFTLGGFYSDQSGSVIARVDLNYSGIDFIHGPDATPSSSKAAFLNVALHPTDALSLTGGIRYSKDKKTYTYFRSNPDGSLPGPCNFAAPGGPTGNNNEPNCLQNGLWNLTDTFEGSRWDYRLVADYKITNDFLVYASYSTGYKGGGVNPYPYYGPALGECSALPPGSTAPCNQLKSFDPETLQTYEAGIKADLFDRRLRLNAAGFYNKFDNIILNVNRCPGSPCAQPNNIGKADVKGFELEMQAFPVDGLSLDGSLAYLDFGYTQITNPNTPITLDMTTPYTPEWSYSFGVQYDHETAIGTFSARVDGAYQSETYGNAINNQYSLIDSYFAANGRLSWTDQTRDWQVSLEVQNLFDRYYYLTVFDQATGRAGQVEAQPALPRTWAVTVKRNF